MNTVIDRVKNQIRIEEQARGKKPGALTSGQFYIGDIQTLLDAITRAETPAVDAEALGRALALKGLQIVDPEDPLAGMCVIDPADLDALVQAARLYAQAASVPRDRIEVEND